jgi:hypothetical protein
MKEIGGYYDLEFSNIELGNLHSSAIKLNSGRYGLDYLIKANKYKRIYVPYYICEVIYEPLRANNVAYEFYHVNEQMEPVDIPHIKDDEAFLYLNNFGLKNDYITRLAGKVKNLIVDNCQALFADAVPGIDTFYSLRKFVGVPDGAFLYSNKKLKGDLPHYDSSITIDHLYKRGNVTANAGFMQFRENELKLTHIGLGQMSVTTQKFIKTYDFEKHKLIRDRNFLFLHHYLGKHNEFGIIDPAAVCGPLYYPFLVSSKTLKHALVSHKVYVSTLFPDITKAVPTDSYENYLAHHLLRLPVDQRYSIADMQRILDLIEKHL